MISCVSVILSKGKKTFFFPFHDYCSVLQETIRLKKDMCPIFCFHFFLLLVSSAVDFGKKKLKKNATVRIQIDFYLMVMSDRVDIMYFESHWDRWFVFSSFKNINTNVNRNASVESDAL